jgi:hypothetical protein
MKALPSRPGNARNLAGARQKAAVLEVEFLEEVVAKP